MIEKIAHITDLHLDETNPFNDKTSARKRFRKILDDIHQNNIDHVVCTGDIGIDQGIPYFFEGLKNMKLSLCLGNHDHFLEICDHYPFVVDHPSKKSFYSRVNEPFKFIFLDSSSGEIDAEQLHWLSKELNTPKPMVIFMHHPVLGLPLKVDEIGRLKNRNEVREVLVKTSNPISIFCGHYHMESTLAYRNITQFISPAVAFQIEKHPETIAIDTHHFGYRVIQIHGNTISSAVKLFHAD